MLRGRRLKFRGRGRFLRRKRDERFNATYDFGRVSDIEYLARFCDDATCVIWGAEATREWNQFVWQEDAAYYN